MTYKKLYLYSVLLSISFVMIEIGAFLIITFLDNVGDIKYSPINTTSLSIAAKLQISKLLNDDFDYVDYNPILGWDIKKNGESGLYKSNSQGIRSNIEYEIVPPVNSIRISSFGDSFTHGDEVKFNETWQEFLRELIPSTEVLNFGVPAYGLDQAYLRYLNQGLKFSPDIVLIGFMSADIERNVNVFPPFFVPGSAFHLTKPRFIPTDTTLQLIPNPIKRRNDYSKFLDGGKSVFFEIQKHDYHIKNPFHYVSGFEDISNFVKLIKMTYFSVLRKISPPPHFAYYQDTSSEPFKITIQLFEMFYRKVIENGSIPIIVVFPEKNDIVNFKQTNEKSYENLLNEFRLHQYSYIDCLDIMKSEMGQLSLMPGGHYTSSANKLVAKHISEYLKNIEVNKTINN